MDRLAKQATSYRRGLRSAVIWFKVGLGVKRWLLILGLGALVVGMGMASLIIAMRLNDLIPLSAYRVVTLHSLPTWARVVVPLGLGGGLILLAIVRLGQALIAPFDVPAEDVAQSLYLYGRQRKGPRIVAVGGGTGLPTLLRGLADYTHNITAVVTVADDGGSSGRLRRELGLLPPGDFRNNIAALARDETLMTQLLQYRFAGQPGGNGTERPEVGGHAFGNILLAALSGVTGSFEEGLAAIGRVLAMRGRVLPSTLANVNLVAQIAMEDTPLPVQVQGESAIPRAGGRIERVALDPPDAPAYPPAIRAILDADVVIIGPGSLFTSLLPNLLIRELAEALRYTRALRIYVCNLATQPGETDNYAVSDHVQSIVRHLDHDQAGVGSWIDVVLANDNLSLPVDTGGGQTCFVQPRPPSDVPMILADLVDIEQPWRHDSEKLTRAVIELLSMKKENI